MSRIREAARRRWPELVMLVSIAGVFVVAAWSASSELDASLEAFSQRQTLLATAIAADFEDRLAAVRRRDPSPSVLSDKTVDDELLDGARNLELRGGVTVLAARPRERSFVTTDGRVIPSSRLRVALDGSGSFVEIPRDEAVAFGLPRRLAIAGLARVDSGEPDPWGVVVLASAERLLDRQRHESWRLALTVIGVTVLAAGFGGLARRRQRRELELERQVAVAALEREREALLTKADKMAALAALSTGIAHEVGTPLGVIAGRVEQVLDRGVADERSTAALRIVQEQVARIHAIIRACLALARGEAPLLVKTPAAELATRAVALVKHRFDNAAVELSCDVESALPPVACEPALFEQALVNLLLNACEATERGGRVALSVHAEHGQVTFVVEDDGAGIPDSIAVQAKEPFFSTKREDGGSGLGLTIAQEIVSHHSGELSLSRREGASGTRATIAVKI